MVKESSNYKSRIAFFAMCIFSTLLVFVLFLLLANSAIINDRAKLDALVRGDAYRPFAYRALLPWMTQFISAITPQSLQEAIESSLLSSESFQRVLSIYHINESYLYEQVLILVLSYLFFLGFPYAFRYLLTGVYETPERLRNLLSVIAPLGLVPFLLYNYIYDFPQLTLFTLALGLMLRRRWYLYLLVYGLGCLNKETTIFLLIPFLLYFRNRLDRRRLVSLLVLQLGVWIVIKSMLEYIYRNNPGSIIEYHLGEHLSRYIEVMRDSPGINLFYIVLIGLVLWMVLYHYREHSQFLIYTSVIVFPIAVLYFLFGTPYEVRVFYEVYPCLMLLCMFRLGQWKGLEISVIESIKTASVGII